MKSIEKYVLMTFILLLILGVYPWSVPHAYGAKARGPALLLKMANQDRKDLYASRKKRKYRHNWIACIERYRKIYKSYPKSSQAPWAMYHAARLYTGLYLSSGRKSDLDKAISIYKDLIATYKKHRLADDAQYKIGEIYYRYKNNLTKAYLEFLKIEIRFPSGDMCSLAKKRLDELSVKISKQKEKGVKPRSSKKGKACVKKIRHWSTPSYTRVVIDLDSPVKYSRRLLKADTRHSKPARLCLDLKGAVIGTNIDKQFPIMDGLLRRVRAGQYSPDTVRIVLDIQTAGNFKVFPLHDPFRIVVDAMRLEHATKSRIIAGRSPPKLHLKKRKVRHGVKLTKKKDNTVSLARQLGLNVNTIVIDPGHGGKDPGCLVSRNIEEKDIVLSLARILAKKIKKEIGCKVILTRTRDVFIPLERRTAIANIKKADLFISLHVNAHRDRKVSGIETYFLNMATDENAVMVAARENATLKRNLSDLQAILNDLMLNTKLHESNRLAHCIQERTVSTLRHRYRGVNSLGVKQAPFYVLIGAQMPAVLIETGFLTNRNERRRLLSKTYQERLSEGICRGIKDYIESINHVADISQVGR